jgi:8-hydroxy-5-deazaflavin:NADPH oxidoreductase
MTTTTNPPGRAAMTGVEGVSKSSGQARALAGEGSRVARDLVRGGERVVLAARDKPDAGSPAAGLGEPASPATVADAAAQADTVVFAVWPAAGKELISRLSPALAGKVVTGPSDPAGPDGHGGLARTLPESESAASVVAKLLPAGARYVKASGTAGAGEPGSAARPESGGPAEKKAGVSR